MTERHVESRKLSRDTEGIIAVGDEVLYNGSIWRVVGRNKEAQGQCWWKLQQGHVKALVKGYEVSLMMN